MWSSLAKVFVQVFVFVFHTRRAYLHSVKECGVIHRRNSRPVSGVGRGGKVVAKAHVQDVFISTIRARMVHLTNTESVTKEAKTFS